MQIKATLYPEEKTSSERKESTRMLVKRLGDERCVANGTGRNTMSM
jgi:hypothetical protein